MCWLLSEGGLEEIVAQDSEREDGSGKEVTGWARSTSEEPCEDLIVMLLTKNALVRIYLGFSGEKKRLGITRRQRFRFMFRCMCRRRWKCEWMDAIYLDEPRYCTMG